MNKNILDTSKMFESKIRIQMIASLSVSDLTFNQLKKICQCTNGNMTTHTTKLIDSGFIEKSKEFINDKPQTTYHLTDFGRSEFNNYVQILSNLIKEINK